MNEFKKIKIGIASPDRIRFWSSGEVTKPETINYRTFRPERKGLFCEKIFGPVKDWECSCGKYRRVRYRGIVCERCGVEVTHSKVRRERMGHIELAAPVAHIWYFRGVPSYIGVLMDMTTKALEEVIYYDSYIVTYVAPELDGVFEKGQRLSEIEHIEAKEKYGEKFKADIGARAIRGLLADLDLSKMAASIKEELETASGQKKIKLIKRYRVIETFITSGNKPEWMIMDVIPVIPPDLRPMVQLEGGRFATSDLNDLYRRVINRNNRLKRLLDIGAPDMIIKNEKRMLQEAVDTLMNNGRRGRVVTGSNGRPLKSLSDIIQGKQGRFRQNLLGKRVDYSGRSVIVVGPHLKLHQCGLPKSMALELFKPFIIRKLVELGHVQNVKSAKRKIERGDVEVWDVLENVIKGHPVLLNRAPTLHRLGIQAFEPVLVEGKAIQLHPLVCTAFNADFDGDQMAIHIPLTIEAQAEARILMLANNNCLAPSNGRPIITPSQDMILGIYYLTISGQEPKDGRTKNFKDINDVLAAYELDLIDIHEWIVVRIDKQRIKTTAGKVIFNDAIRHVMTEQGIESKVFFNESVGKKVLADLIYTWFEDYGSQLVAFIADKLKEVGFRYATIAGISFTMEDLVIPSEKKQHLDDAQKEVTKIAKLHEDGLLSARESRSRQLEVWRTTSERVTESMIKEFDPLNNVYMMATSGARGSIDQVKQLSAMRGLMADARGNTVNIPILANFKEGLSSTEYFISTYGARKGLVDTALRTADSGYLTRRLVDIVQDIFVTEEDCRSREGVRISAIREGFDEIISLEERLIGRVSMEDVYDIDKKTVLVGHGQEISIHAAKVISKAEIDSVLVRSVITCKAKNGLCRKCYGRDLSSNRLINIGEAVGIIAAQSIGEPGTQLTMRTFHTGGVDLSKASKIEVRSKKGGVIQYGPNMYPQFIYNEYGELIFVAGRDGKIIVTHSDGKQSVYQVPQGAVLFVKEKELAEDDLMLFTYISNFEYSVAERAGRVMYDGIDVVESKNSTGTILAYLAKTDGNLIVIDETKQKSFSYDEKDKMKVKRGQLIRSDMDLTSHVKSDITGVVTKIDKKTGIIVIKPAESYHVLAGTNLFVGDNSEVSANQMIMRQEMTISDSGSKARDIVSGLPRVEALFEARGAKNKAFLSEVDGNVELVEKDGFKVIAIMSDSGENVEYKVPLGTRIKVFTGKNIRKGDMLTEGVISPHDILLTLGVQAAQEYLLEEVQKVYRGQGVHINDKHIEVILRQMSRRVKIVNMGDSSFLPGELIDVNEFEKETRKLMMEGKNPAGGERVLLGITKAALNTESFISAASFQETSKVLTVAAVSGKVDDMYGLKENVIIGKLMPAGTGYFAGKNIKISGLSAAVVTEVGSDEHDEVLFL